MTIYALLQSLQSDPLRSGTPFSSDISEANSALLDAGCDDGECTGIMNQWLRNNQPCLFGRIAAQKDLLRFCFLRDEDFQLTDDHIQQKIQRARTAWHRATFEGRASGFILLLISELIIRAAPSKELFSIAQRICSLYLLKDIAPNVVYLEEAYLEDPRGERHAWKWDAGVNFFGVQGDRRWWHDHRIPGGIGFSVNSVGHMVKSGRLLEDLGTSDVSSTPAAPAATTGRAPIPDLGKALVIAMQTIARAAQTESGPATWLQEAAMSEVPLLPCPVTLPGPLVGKNHCEYKGWYHTDESLPAEYFGPAVLRPTQQEAKGLDLSYLFHSGTENFDHPSMGPGRQIRTHATEGVGTRPVEKVGRLEPDRIDVRELAFLKSSG